ncbi:MAG: glycoside hydrolase family 16 protein [Planctomycetia bacterium]|nr:glycoside hydrolase family 16 protein [Planctomycetia bacterium]
MMTRKSQSLFKRGVAGIGIVLLALLSGGATLVPKAPDIAAPVGWHWKLTWSDQFHRGAVDLKAWHYDVGGGGWGNGESEIYTHSRKNVYVAHGKLHIVVIGKKVHGKVHYTSGRITTRNVFSQKYGLFEFRARLPRGTGLWPAIWMMPKKSKFGTWPRSGEIDIMESRGNGIHQVQGSLHSGDVWNQDNCQTKVYTLPRHETTTRWHTYALEWEPMATPTVHGLRIVEFKWFVDGHLYETRQGGWTVPTTAGMGHPNAPFNQRFYIIINMAVGGNYAGGKTPGPGRYVMKVDFIKAFELTKDKS